MGKKKSWFSAVKRLFIPEGKRKEDKKSKRRGWFFGRLKTKQFPAISVPQRTLIEANEEQRKHAMVVAVATAAAAEAAVSAAHAAAEVVRLTSTPSNFGKITRNLAATRIQTLFRAYLARKALKALKGVVLLQAVIRGENVRRQIITHMKSLQSILKPQVHQMRVSGADENCVHGNEIQSFSPEKMVVNKENNDKLGCKSNNTWEYSLFTKEDMEVSWLQKKDASIKRDRMKKFSYSHRERPNIGVSREFPNKEDGRKKPWFEELQDVRVCTANQTQKLKETIQSNSTDIATSGRRQHKLKNVVKGESMEILNSSLSLPRRSFCRANKQEYSIMDDTSLPNSPVFPTYMAATESAKAKIRSASTPRQRLGHLDFFSVHSSLYKPMLSSWNSWDGDLAGIKGKSATSQHKSLRI